MTNHSQLEILMLRGITIGLLEYIDRELEKFLIVYNFVYINLYYFLLFHFVFF